MIFEEKPEKKVWQFETFEVGCIKLDMPYCPTCGMSPLTTVWKYISNFCPHCGEDLRASFTKE